MQPCELSWAAADCSFVVDIYLISLLISFGLWVTGGTVVTMYIMRLRVPSNLWY